MSFRFSPWIGFLCFSTEPRNRGLRLQEPTVWREGLPSGKNFRRQKMPATCHFAGNLKMAQSPGGPRPILWMLATGWWPQTGGVFVASVSAKVKRVASRTHLYCYCGWLRNPLLAPRNDTRVETITLVGIYVGESNHSRDSCVVRNGFRPSTVAPPHGPPAPTPSTTSPPTQHHMAQSPS